MSSRRATKKAALAALKSGGGKLDSVTFEDPDDVYETMDEEQYRDYVDRKRQREDFVVDDGTLIL